MVPDAAWPGSDQWPWSTAPATSPVGRLGRPSVSDQWGLGSLLSVGRPTYVRCAGPLGSCSLVRPLGALLCLCGVLGNFGPLHRCAIVVCCVASAVSWATCLLFTGALARCVVLRVGCPGPLGTRSPVCPLGVLCWVCGVPGHVAPVQRCARSVCCVVWAVSWATWLLFTSVPARCVALRVGFPGPLGSRSPVCPLGVLCCVCGVLGHLAPVHRCAGVVCCVATAVSWATWLLFTRDPARCVVLPVQSPGSLGSCSPVCPLGVLCCVCGVPGHLAPVHRCARSVFCFASVVSWAPWLLFTCVPARCAALCARCPGPIGSCSPVCQAVVSRPFAALGACACAVSWLTLRLFTGVHAVCGAGVPLVVVSLFLSPNFLFCFCFFSCLPFVFVFGKKRGARVHCRHRHGQLVQRCKSVVFSGVCRRCFGGGRAPGVRLARPDVQGYGSVQVWLVAWFLLVLARLVALWAVGVGCDYVAPSLGLVRSQRLAVMGCGSGYTCVGAFAGLGGFDGCGLGFGAVGRSGARWRARWRPSASILLGVFSPGPGMAPQCHGWLGNGVGWWRRWLGGQGRCAVWRAGLLGCCLCRRCRCADACGLVRGLCVRGRALGDAPQTYAVWLRLLEGLLQSSEYIRVVLGCGQVARVDSQGLERIGQHGFPCSLRHLTPAGWRRRFSADPLRSRWTRPSREGAARAHFCSSQSCVWVQHRHRCPWAGPLPWAEEWAWVGVMWS